MDHWLQKLGKLARSHPDVPITSWKCYCHWMEGARGSKQECYCVLGVKDGAEVRCVLLLDGGCTRQEQAGVLIRAGV